MPSLLLSLMLSVGVSAAGADPVVTRAQAQKRVDRLLRKTPLIDGHNDAPWAIHRRGGLDAVPFDGDTLALEKPMHTDIPRLRTGQAGGQFWSVWVPPGLTGPESVQATVEQIDLVWRMAEKFPDDLQMVTTADGLRAAHKAGRVGSLVGMEGGHSVGGSLSVLRQMYAMGARYMTLTHWRTNEWADAATDDPQHGGLSPFGEQVVAEMNRLGMLVDLSHVSADAMSDALDVSKAPVIFSHSGVVAVNGHPRNVPDEILARLPENGGVLMVDYLPAYVSDEVWRWKIERKAAKAGFEARYIGDTAAVDAAMEEWKGAHPAPKATMDQVIAHIEHARSVAGAAHLGLGGDYDGMDDAPIGLEDVSKVPDLLVALATRGWTDAELAGLAGENVLRAMAHAEAVATELQGSQSPIDARSQPFPEVPED